MYRYVEMREEEGIYEDINCESSEVLGKKTGEKVGLDEPSKSSAKIGIIISSDKPHHTYVNIEESGTRQEEEFGLDVGGINKEVTAQIHENSDESDKNNGSGNDCAVFDDGKSKEEGLKENKNEGVEQGSEVS